jgi:hypothetical protein
MNGKPEVTPKMEFCPKSRPTDRNFRSRTKCFPNVQSALAKASSESNWNGPDPRTFVKKTISDPVEDEGAV